MAATHDLKTIIFVFAISQPQITIALQIKCHFVCNLAWPFNEIWNFDPKGNLKNPKWPPRQSQTP